MYYRVEEAVEEDKLAPCLRFTKWMQRKERADPPLDVGRLCDQLIKLNHELCGLPSQTPCSDTPKSKKNTGIP